MAKFDKVIPPGQEGKVTLEIDGKRVHGTFNKSATVISNDPKHPRMTLTLSGTIRHYVEVQPADRVYLAGMFGEPVEKEIDIISNESGENFAITKLESNIDEKITYKVDKGNTPNSFKIRIWKNPKLPAVNTWGSIKVHTNSKHSPEKVIQVNVTTRAMIKAQPSIINFGRVQVGGKSQTPKGYQKTITVSKIKGEFKIKHIDFSRDYYSASINPIESGRKYVVRVNFTPDSSRRNYSDEMIIKTDDPQEPTLKIRLIARTL